MKKQLMLLVAVIVIIGAGSWLGVRVQSQAVETPEAKASEFLKIHEAEDTMMPYRVSFRDHFGIQFAENSQWVVATNHDSLITAGLLAEGTSQEAGAKRSAWDTVLHRYYYSGRIPMAYWNRKTPNAAVILAAPDDGRQWAYREFLYNDASQDWELTNEQVIPNPLAEGLHYTYEVVRDQPDNGDITFRVQVVNDRGENLNAVQAAFSVPELSFGAPPSPELRPGMVQSPFDIVFDAKYVSQMSDKVQVDVLLINDLSGEMLRETITVNTR